MLELQKHAYGVSKRYGVFNCGVSFTLLGQFESDGLNTGLDQVGRCADKLSVFADEYAEKETLYFEEPIMGYIRLVQAVRVVQSILLERQHSSASYSFH